MKLPRLIAPRRARAGRAGWAVASALAISGLACESPSVPFDTGQYEFRLVVATGSPKTFHWGPGAEVPVYVNQPEVQGRPSLSVAMDVAGATWTRAAVFSEVRLRQTANLDEAVAVLQWKDTEPILSTPIGCTGPSTGAAFTRGCLAPHLPSPARHPPACRAHLPSPARAGDGQAANPTSFISPLADF